MFRACEIARVNARCKQRYRVNIIQNEPIFFLSLSLSLSLLRERMRARYRGFIGELDIPKSWSPENARRDAHAYIKQDNSGPPRILYKAHFAPHKPSGEKVWGKRGAAPRFKLYATLEPPKSRRGTARANPSHICGRKKRKEGRVGKHSCFYNRDK